MRFSRVRFLAIAVAMLLPLSPALAADPPAPATAPSLDSIPELNKPVTMDFKDAPLEKVLEYLHEKTGVPFIVDQEFKGVNPTVTLQVANKSALSVLNILKNGRLLSGDIAFDYSCGDGLVWVAPKNILHERRKLLRTYDILALCMDTSVDSLRAELLHEGTSADGFARGGPNPPANNGSPLFGEKADEIVNLIKESIARESWTDSGGSLSIRRSNFILIVIATPEIHQEIAHLLDDLQKIHTKTLTVEGFLVSLKTADLIKLVAEKGRGTRVLDRSAADQLLSQCARGEGGFRLVGTLGAPCPNGQRVLLTVGTCAGYLSSYKVLQAEGTSALEPAITTLLTGTILEVTPTALQNDEAVSLNVHATCNGHSSIRTLETTLMNRFLSNANFYGNQYTLATQPGHPENGPTVGGSPLAAVISKEGRSLLEFPSYANLEAKTLVKVPNGGAVLISGTSTEIQKFIGEGNEIVFLLRATVNK